MPAKSDHHPQFVPLTALRQSSEIADNSFPRAADQSTLYSGRLGQLDWSLELQKKQQMTKKSKSLPRHAIVLHRYSELDQYAHAFADGHLPSLVLIGSHGVGKSTHFRNALGSNFCWIEGNASPFRIYVQAFQHANQPIVLDDVDGLYRDPQGVCLLKSLCQTDPVRTVGWQSQARDLDRLEIPREFRTTSPVALICNDWETISPNVAALEDRVHLLVFQPTPLEIHRQCAQWFEDQEVFDFIAIHLPLLEQPSLRLYVLAAQLKNAGFDWRAAVLNHCFDGTTRVVAQLRADPSYETEADRIRAFVDGGHGCRATYFNHLRRLPSAADAPDIELMMNSPAQVVSGATDSNVRHRRLGRRSTQD